MEVLFGLAPALKGPDHLLLIALDPKNAGRSDAGVVPFFREVRERVSALPGVQGVAFSTMRLMADSRWTAAAAVEGFTPSATAPQAARNAVGPDYFRTVGIRLVAGREFTTGDDGSAPKVAIVNQSFARLYFARQSPLGKKIGADIPEHTIVGVAGDARYAHVRDAAPPQWYVPYEQRPKRLCNCGAVDRPAG